MTKHTIILVCFLLPQWLSAQYSGTGSVTQGPASLLTSNLYSCAGGRVTSLGSITATDSSHWTVPAEVNFSNAAFPLSDDLYNSCNGHTHANTAAALASLSGSGIVTVDSGGELITGFIFADNYFELYVNGVPVGKDAVPYTQFNSSVVRFRVKRPFTLSMLLVDWEENLGLGSENNNGFTYHPGDGGMVAVFRDSSNHIVATTGSEWKAQTFYTSPISDLSCPTENGSSRLSGNCSTQDSNNGSAYYGLHWGRPTGWTDASFNDQAWPQATTYSNNTIGVNNKPAYMNFTDVFDDPSDDAEFIWSSNVILDNEVIVRYTVDAPQSREKETGDAGILLYPQPVTEGRFRVTHTGDEMQTHPIAITLINAGGQVVLSTAAGNDWVRTAGLPAGIYTVIVQSESGYHSAKIILEN